MRNLTLLTLLFTLYSCSIFENLREMEKESQRNSKDIPKRDSVNFCSVKKIRSSQLYGSNPQLKKLFLEYIQKHKFSFLESSFLYTYLQLYNRPDTLSTHSRIYLLLRNKKKFKSVMLIPEKVTNNLMAAFKEIIDRPKQRILISHFHNNFQKIIPIDKNYQQYLQDNKATIYNNKDLRKIFYKGNQIIKYGESLPIRRVQLFHKKLTGKPNPIYHFFKKDSDTSCSFDPHLFSSTPILERNVDDIHSNVFGYFKSKEQFFVMISANKINLDSIAKRTTITEYAPINSLNSAVCFSASKQMLLVSTDQIHSEQILANLLSQKSLPTTEKEIYNFINTKRSINLLYPKRTISEVYGIDYRLNKKPATMFVPILGHIDIIKSENKVITSYIDPRKKNLVCK